MKRRGQYRPDPQGSKWHRWDPHIHVPGTLFEDRYNGDWEGFLKEIETSDPPIRALGVTDYYVPDLYKEVIEWREKGRLQNVEVIFPNVELRYGIGTKSGSPVNVHLLVSPANLDHFEELQRFLSQLTFNAKGEDWQCSRDGLIALGRKIADDPKLLERAALVRGARAFKVNETQLRKVYDDSDWARENVLIATEAGSKDGTSGLQDGSLQILRKEMEKFSHVIFSSQESDREFWLGRSRASIEELKKEWGGCKCCLHGSDAHEVSQVGKPAKERYTWIKGDLTFESLWQASLEPHLRAFVGREPPQGALSSQVISSVSVSNATWLKTPSIPLNRGLVAVIGARGSGKTALVDFIAAAGNALSDQHLTSSSFARRASEFLEDSTATVQWETGESSACSMSGVGGDPAQPRIQYLSQQFVEAVSSAEGLEDALLAEIHRVLFDAHPIDDRMGTASFGELLKVRTSRADELRTSHENSLREIVRQLLVESQRHASLPALQTQRDQLAKRLENDKKERAKLMGAGKNEVAKLLDQVSRAKEHVQLRIQKLRRREEHLKSLREQARDILSNQAPLTLNRLKAAYPEAGLQEAEWKAFHLRFTGEVEEILQRHVRETETIIARLYGAAIQPAEINRGPKTKSFLADGVSLNEQPFYALQAEIARLQVLSGIDKQNELKLRQIAQQIAKQESSLSEIERQAEDASKAKGRINDLRAKRRDTYAEIFSDIINKEAELQDLYAPLKERLASEKGALQKLSFSIRRTVDIESWAERGERLLDLRKAFRFKGEGALLEAARKDLLAAWETGSAHQAADAITKFRDDYDADFMGQSPENRNNREAFRSWAARLSEWLYGTEHIRVDYAIQYEKTNIEQLSPGSRGIVLLLLYLAVDQQDDRPLVIDQPEENLDPKSIYDELVQYFRSAKDRRQIIVVTHNANLVINADADQIIVARAGSHRPGQLPKISYVSGGLENPSIRAEACDILEGGKEAFRERARRWRISV